MIANKSILVETWVHQEIAKLRNYGETYQQVLVRILNLKKPEDGNNGIQ
jgi:hypothetical protein